MYVYMLYEYMVYQLHYALLAASSDASELMSEDVEAEISSAIQAACDEVVSFFNRVLKTEGGRK